MCLKVPVCSLINLPDISIFVIIKTLPLTFNTNNFAKPPIFEVEYFFLEFNP